MSLLSLLGEEAAAAGFAAFGGVDLDSASEIFSVHVARYDRWLAKGHAGEMGYLVRGRDRRADPRLVMPGCESVYCVLLPYRKTAPNDDLARGPRYARYLQGSDYHDDIATRLDAMMSRVSMRAEISGLSWKNCVDTSAVLERSWAALAGLGWIGKNTLLIHPKHGSFLFIGAVLLNQRLGAAPRPLPDYCGHCSRCLSACPTQAFVEPRLLDSNRCISYLTLEKRGELPENAPPPEKFDGWIAGCDRCQEVCPFNLKPARADRSPPPRGATSLGTWDELFSETEESYKNRVKGSSLSRVKPAQFRRNLQFAWKSATRPALTSPSAARKD